MTKLEELTAMMVNEIDQFQTAVDKLEKIQKVKMKLDLKKLRNLLMEHQNNLQQVSSQNERWLDLSENAISKAHTLFNRGMMVFLITLILNLIAVVMMFFSQCTFFSF